MKTVSVSLDDAEFAALEKLAASQWGTVAALLKPQAQSLAAGRRAPARRELVGHVRCMKTGLAVGGQPTRERTYHGRRFHRH